MQHNPRSPQLIWDKAAGDARVMIPSAEGGDIMTGTRGISARMAFLAACACALLSLIYAIAQLFEWAGALGSAGGPQSSSTPTGLALLLTPSLLLGPAFLILMAALHQLAADERKAFSQVALAFATIYAALTGLVYFVQLSFVAPRLAASDTADIALLLFIPYRSFLFAIDLLGYSFMSLATLFGAFALPSRARIARMAMIANGLLLPFLAFQMVLPGLIYAASLWGVFFPGAMIALAVSLQPDAGRGRDI